MSGKYTIPVSGQKEGHHSFHFEIDDTFFDLFEESEIKEGILTAVIDAERHATHIDLQIDIRGIVNVCCDRCLGMFGFPVESNNRLLIRFGNAREEEDPDIITLPRDQNELDMAQYLYDYINLALPIKRMHPDDKDGNSTCDPAMLGKLKEHLVDEEVAEDPRWADLKKLMNGN